MDLKPRAKYALEKAAKAYHQYEIDERRQKETLAVQDKANKIGEKANDIAQEANTIAEAALSEARTANKIAEDANDIARKANCKSNWSIGISIVAIVVAVVDIIVNK